MDRKTPPELLTAAEHLARHRKGQPFKAARDPEVRAFIDQGIATMSYVKLADAAREKFGKARAPSKNAIIRYWEALPTAYRDRIIDEALNPACRTDPE